MCVSETVWKGRLIRRCERLERPSVVFNALVRQVPALSTPPLSLLFFFSPRSSLPDTFFALTLERYSFIPTIACLLCFISLRNSWATRRPFRFGVICEHMQSAEEWVTKARQAEEYGYSTLLIRDHFIREPFGDQLAPLIALMAAANATKTLRVGSLVMDNDYRHPVMLAKEAATLDLLSGGRFELGIGAGWLRSEYEQAGMVFEPAGVRVSRLEEAIQVLKALFADQPITFAGDHYTITNLSGFPKPTQRPHPPILVGAGSKRMLALAAREADIVGILPKALPEGA